MKRILKNIKLTTASYMPCNEKYSIKNFINKKKLRQLLVKHFDGNIKERKFNVFHDTKLAKLL